MDEWRNSDDAVNDAHQMSSLPGEPCGHLAPFVLIEPPYNWYLNGHLARTLTIMIIGH